MKRLTPNRDNVILRVIEVEDKIGSIIIQGGAKEESTLAEVMVAASESYYRCGKLRPAPVFNAGDFVRIPKGNVGTGVLEAPDGEKWVCLPEDGIYYKVEEV